MPSEGKYLETNGRSVGRLEQVRADASSPRDQPDDSTCCQVTSPPTESPISRNLIRMREMATVLGFWVSDVSIQRCLCAGITYKNPSEKMPMSMIFCGLFKFNCLRAGIGNKKIAISVMILPPALT